MEDRKSYLGLFLAYLIVFSTGLAIQAWIIPFASIACLIGVVLFIQVKRGYVWDLWWREWKHRKDSPAIYWTFILVAIRSISSLNKAPQAMHVCPR